MDKILFFPSPNGSTAPRIAPPEPVFINGFKHPYRVFEHHPASVSPAMSQKRARARGIAYTYCTPGLFVAVDGVQIQHVSAVEHRSDGWHITTT